MPGGFKERSEEEIDAYLEGRFDEGVTHEDLIEGMERLMAFTREAAFEWENDYYALVYATVVRSTRTYSGICLLLRQGLAVQAAMLTRSLFEDVIFAHWMALNENDQEWLSERFLRHCEAIALYQRKLRRETSFSMGPVLSAPDDLEGREDDLIEEFGRQATRDWWDPGKEGHGKGKDLGLRKIVVQLEQVAANKERFHPRFAGGEEPLLERIDRTIHKWLSQCVHHTAVGLPFTPIGNDEVEVPPDPFLLVGFSASWLFAQQVYLIHELNHAPYDAIDAVWLACMTQFTRVFLGAVAAGELADQWDEHYVRRPEDSSGEDEDDRGTAPLNETHASGIEDAAVEETLETLVRLRNFEELEKWLCTHGPRQRAAVLRMLLRKRSQRHGGLIYAPWLDLLCEVESDPRGAWQKREAAGLASDRNAERKDTLKKSPNGDGRTI